MKHKIIVTCMSLAITLLPLDSALAYSHCNRYGGRAKEQLSQTSPAMCTDDYQFYLFSPDYFFQLCPYITLDNNHLMRQTGECPTLNEEVLQLAGIPANRLGGRKYSVRTHKGETQ